jgi:hypothetical protein
MSPVCQLEMTLPRGFLGVWGDGSADQRWRAAAARGAARFGSATASAVSDQVAPCSPPPNPSPIIGESLNQHSRWYSRPLDGGGSGWGRICAECVYSIGNRSNARGGGPADRRAVHRRQRRGHEGRHISTGSCRRRQSRRR